MLQRQPYWFPFPYIEDCDLLAMDLVVRASEVLERGYESETAGIENASIVI